MDSSTWFSWTFLRLRAWLYVGYAKVLPGVYVELFVKVSQCPTIETHVEVALRQQFEHDDFLHIQKREWHVVSELSLLLDVRVSLSLSRLRRLNRFRIQEENTRRDINVLITTKYSNHYTNS